MALHYKRTTSFVVLSLVAVMAGLILLADLFAPLQRTYAQTDEPTSRVEQAHHMPGIINVTAFGAKGNGIIDDSVAFKRAITAMAAGPNVLSAHSPCRSLYIPPGTYLVASPEIFHLVAADSGCGIYGAGPFSSVVKFTFDQRPSTILHAVRSGGLVTLALDSTANFAPNQVVVVSGNSDRSFDGSFAVEAVTSRQIMYAQAGPNSRGTGGSASIAYAFLHDEGAGDGPLQEFTMRDIGFSGPGASGHLDWFWNKGTGGTGGMRWDNVRIAGFVEGYVIEGTAGADTLAASHLQMRDVDVAFHLDNPQAVPNDLDAPDICAAKNVFVVGTRGAAGWTITGGYLCTLTRAGNIFYFDNSFRGGLNNQNLTVIGTHFELLGGHSMTGELFRSEGQGSALDFTCVNCAADTIQGNAPRPTVTLTASQHFTWLGGVLGGQVVLKSLNGGHASGTLEPRLTMIAAVWDPAAENAVRAACAVIEKRCVPSSKRCVQVSPTSAHHPTALILATRVLAAHTFCNH